MKYDICLHTDTRKAFVGGYYTAVSLQHQILLSICTILLLMNIFGKANLFSIQLSH